MSTAFSSSLFGLAGSLILGFLDLQVGQASNRFFNELEDWLSQMAIFTTSNEGGNIGLGESALENLAIVSKRAVQNSLFLEKLIKRDLEVLFMCDPIDEYCMQQLKEFDDKKFVDINTYKDLEKTRQIAKKYVVL